MDLSYVKGDRVILRDGCCQTFVGVVKSVNADLGRILLDEVVQMPEGKSISGYRNFDIDELVEIKKYEFDKAEENDADNCEKPNEKPLPELSESKLEEIKKLQSEYRYIKDFGTNFHTALSALRTCDRIGVYGKDVSKGRFARASILAISSQTNIFVFDLLKLGDDMFVKGLKDILESPKIVKVVHDCRLLSDCLKHKHRVQLENVRDVEAEDVIVVYQERRTIRKHSRPLDYLLKVYLGVEAEDCAEDTWTERPLAPNLLETLVFFVSFLLPLQEEIERKYLQLLIDASNLYNTCVRDLSFLDVLCDDTKRTLRKQFGKLLTPLNQTRGDCGPKKIPQ